MANKASAGGIVMVWITLARGIRLGMVMGWTIDSKGSAPSFRIPGAGSVKQENWWNKSIQKGGAMEERANNEGRKKGILCDKGGKEKTLLYLRRFWVQS
ncbi:hypothetical protein GCK72_022609 [Caenorhabditis remanei]|uniref:Uncharacterized protein n=1 Tax=Caenorhabditis remanei TaxID=31234 RepID=A0A6A5FUH7_CAERE|nr:hypothetical protein GCK72_022609 [Caenorhabditis remanei]KAF1746156.1 hypothetical protein GCK72_022609 [Caenorhabditis remanei]